MYSIHNRDDLEYLKNLQETKSLLRKERLKEKLVKQDFHYDLEKVFEPVTAKLAESTENQKQLSEKQLQALRDSSQTTRQAIENQTRAIQESNNTLHKSLQKSIKQGRKDYDEITNRNYQLLWSLVNYNQVDYSIVKMVSNLLNDKNRSQFSLEPITQSAFGNGNSNLFTINPSNPKYVLIKGSTMITFIRSKCPRSSVFYI